MRLWQTAKLTLQNYQFRRWRKRNPGSQFKDYFAKVAKDDLAEGKNHPSLGKETRESGRDKVVRYGLLPTDVCVDYGCGTLRVGKDIIRYLEPKNYWGLEIDRDLIELGKDLLGPELIDTKAPNLRVISREVIEEAAAARPFLLCSFKVLIHVHPEELKEYFDNILTIVNSGGAAIITGQWSPTETYQFARQSWAHSLDLLSGIACSLGGDLSVEKQRDFIQPDLERKAKSGTLRLVRRVQR